jgi:hypothetical protein
VPINVAVAGEDGFMDVKYSGGIDGGASAYTQAGSFCRDQIYEIDNTY